MDIRLYAGLLAFVTQVAVTAESAEQMLVESRTYRGDGVTFFVLERDALRAKSSIPGTMFSHIIIGQESGQIIAELKTPGSRLVVQLGGAAIAEGILAFDGSRLPDEQMMGALSPDGSKLCLSTLCLLKKNNDGISKLWIVDLHSLKCSAIYEIDGVLSPAAWAPDGRSLAFYFGSHKAIMDDSFEVAVMTYIDDKWVFKPVAPKSLPYNRSPSRSNPPAWIGPKGEHLLIEARYEGAEKGTNDCIVTVANGNLRNVSGICATCFPGHERIAYVQGETDIVTFNPNNGQTDTIVRGRDVIYPKLSPDGKLIAFFDKSTSAVVVREIASGKEWKTGSNYPITTGSNFFWIRKIGDSTRQD